MLPPGFAFEARKRTVRARVRLWVVQCFLASILPNVNPRTTKGGVKLTLRKRALVGDRRKRPGRWKVNVSVKLFSTHPPSTLGDITFFLGGGMSRPF